jgi:hypothetical protein
MIFIFFVQCTLIKYFPIYEEAGSHIWLCNCSILNFLMRKIWFSFLSLQSDCSCRAAQNKATAAHVHTVTFVFILLVLNLSPDILFVRVIHRIQYENLFGKPDWCLKWFGTFDCPG